MKEFEYTPKLEGFEGTINLKVPNYQERMELVKEHNLMSLGKQSDAKAMEKMAVMAKKVNEYIVSMDCVCNDIEFKSMDDLSYYLEYQILVNELIQVLMGGMSLTGKSLKDFAKGSDQPSVEESS